MSLIGLPLFVGVWAGFAALFEMDKKKWAKQKKATATIRITVGLDKDGELADAGGDIPDVQVFSEAGEFLGKNINHEGAKVKTGEFADIAVKQEHDSLKQPAYALIGAHRGDGICIATALITWPDGNNYAWMGDWGCHCGGRWYYSNIYVQPSGISPRCLWIDSDDDNISTGFQIHWPEFSHAPGAPFPNTTEDKEAKTKYLCEAGPPFTLFQQPNKHPNEIQFWADWDSSDPDRGGQVVKTAYGNNAKHHSAEELCDSPTSLGPDFFDALAGTFCRMSDKTLWPACNGDNITDNCFNSTSHHLVANGIAAMSQPYSNIIDWTLGTNGANLFPSIGR
ncbi:hypothetical protein F5Y10DRAFT_294551 [Nemania abortiva]|nr:hypothetical protein F5Y10DRAFT_294551 [Nemania abortiva]